MAEAFDLPWLILLDTMAAKGNVITRYVHSGFDEDEVLACVDMLVKAGLLKGDVLRLAGRPVAYQVYGLTEDGEGLLAAYEAGELGNGPKVNG